MKCTILLIPCKLGDNLDNAARLLRRREVAACKISCERMLSEAKQNAAKMKRTFINSSRED